MTLKPIKRAIGKVTSATNHAKTNYTFKEKANKVKLYLVDKVNKN